MGTVDRRGEERVALVMEIEPSGVIVFAIILFRLEKTFCTGTLLISTRLLFSEEDVFHLMRLCSICKPVAAKTSTVYYDSLKITVQ